MARPVKYSKETIAKSLDYIQNYEKYDDVIPSIASLSLVLDVTRETLHDWALYDPEEENKSKREFKKQFSYILKQLKSKQEQVLITNGLNGKFNSNICKLVLGKHNYHDKSENKNKLEGDISISWGKKRK